MITRNPIVPENHVSNPVTDYEFNQDQSCLILSTLKSFEIYNVHPVAHIMSQEMRHLSKVRMLHRTNYVAFVTGVKEVVHIWDDVKKQDVSRIKVDAPVKDLFLSREFIVVSYGDVISVFKFGNPWKRITDDIRFGGVCEFSNGLLVYSNEFNLGQIHITKLQSSGSATTQDQGVQQKAILGKGVLIKAHTNPIKMVRLNRKSDMVATCSQDGTIIRVFKTEDGVLVREFRRGLDRADVVDMKWSTDGSKLAVVSDKWTLHVFEIFNDQDNKRHVLKGWINMKYFQSEWSLCNFKLSVDKHVRGCKVAWISESSLVVVWPHTRMIETFKVVFDDEMERWLIQMDQREQLMI